MDKLEKDILTLITEDSRLTAKKISAMLSGGSYQKMQIKTISLSVTALIPINLRGL